MAASFFSEGTHHCAIFDRDDHGANHRGFKNCELNPGHQQFLTVDEFRNKSHIDLHLEDEGQLEKAWNRINRTVRVVVTHVSQDRPDTYPFSNKPYPCVDFRGFYNRIRYGTGFVIGSKLDTNDNKSYPCFACSSNGRKCRKTKEECYYFEIITATHVIFDVHEAWRTVFELFYDSEDRKDVKCLYGVDMIRRNVETDRCHVLCVTHDSSLADVLNKMCRGSDSLSSGVLVSHPHGVSKRISIGDILLEKCVGISNDFSAKLRKDTEIRFSGCKSEAAIVAYINQRLMNQDLVIGYVYDDEENSKTLKVMCDLEIYYPRGVLMESDYHCTLQYFGASTSTLYAPKWWRSQPGIELVTNCGKRCRIPEQFDSDDSQQTVRMEVFSKLQVFQANISINNRLNFYFTYDMASCPGSSGALVKVCQPSRDLSLHGVHFGTMRSQGNSRSRNSNRGVGGFNYIPY